jgi:type IV secretion system protein VirD4
MRKATPPAREEPDSKPPKRGETQSLLLGPIGPRGRNPSEVDPAKLFATRVPLRVYDPEGHAAKLALRFCRELDKRLVVLDPFHVATDEPATLNPLDTVGAQTLQKGACRLAGYLCDKKQAKNLLSALIAHVLTSQPPQSRNLGHVRDLLAADDFVTWAQTLLDAHPAMHPFAREHLQAFLADEPARQSTLGDARDCMRIFGEPEVRRAVAATNFDYEGLKSGPPPTFYIIIPPARLKSHEALDLLWSLTLPDWEPPV